MGKGTSSKENKTSKEKTEDKKIAFEEILPQNILLIGERGEEKDIYIAQSAYKDVHAFTKNKTKNESGGMLIGNIIEEFGKTNIIIYGFIEAKYTEATPTTLTFTHKTWDYVHKELEDNYENCKIVGWIHTHPDFGIFLSEYDRFIQENFFKEEYQVAYVVDPIQHIEGFYCWSNDKIEKCKGFHIFDKTGEKIEIETEHANEEIKGEEEKKRESADVKPVFMISFCLMFIIVIVFAVISINLSNRMKILEKQQENIVESANRSISMLQQRISGLEEEIDNLNSRLEEKTDDVSEESEDEMNEPAEDN